MFRRLLAYYLPFDSALAFQLPWIWANARQYAYRNAIAGVALAGLSLGAEAHALPLVAATTHACAMAAVFFAAVFTMAAIDPRAR